MKKGVLQAAAAYILWGFLPVYWKALQTVPSVQIVCHRLAWSFVFLMSLVLVTREFSSFKKAAFQSRTLLIYSVAAGLLSVNWLTYIWGVNAGYVVETSLGYFINPLVSVLLGVLILHERLRPLQWIPIVLAALGVAYLTYSYGALPWIALVLAVTFGLYGLMKKIAPLESLHGLTLETAILLLPAVGYLMWVQIQGSGAFGRAGPVITLLLMFTGVVTALPLLLFGSAARKIDLSTLGVLQYISPTCQFLLGVLVYKEPFTLEHLVGFGIIWAALIVYSLEGVYHRRRGAAA